MKRWTHARRWSREHRSLLVREEISALERIQDLGHLELLMLRLPELVGSPLSVNALRKDLQVSHKAVESWIGALPGLTAVSFPARWRSAALNTPATAPWRGERHQGGSATRRVSPGRPES